MLNRWILPWEDNHHHDRYAAIVVVVPRSTLLMLCYHTMYRNTCMQAIPNWYPGPIFATAVAICCVTLWCLIFSLQYPDYVHHVVFSFTELWVVPATRVIL